jgi:hypothetical protein
MFRRKYYRHRLLLKKFPPASIALSGVTTMNIAIMAVDAMSFITVLQHSNREPK